MSDDAKILNEQGVLLFNLDKLAGKRSADGIAASSLDTMDLKTGNVYNNLIGKGDEHSYPQICLLDSADPAAVLSKIKRKRNKKNTITDLLTSMTTFEMSSLVPTVRIFKMFQTSLKEGVEIPVEIPFDTHITGINNIFKYGKGRGSGSGIKSITWKQNPKNEASGATFKLTLDMHLQSIDELLKVRGSSFSGQDELIPIRYLDLLYPPEEMRRATGEGTSIYNPAYFRLKVIVGWTISSGGLESLRLQSTRKQIQKFLDSLQEQTETLYIRFINHDMQFNEDGSIDIQLHYFGEADAKMINISESNVLQYEVELQKEIKEAEEQLNQQLEAEKTPEESHKVQMEEDVGIYKKAELLYDENLADLPWYAKIPIVTTALPLVALAGAPVAVAAGAAGIADYSGATVSHTTTVLKSKVLEKQVETLKKSSKRKKYSFFVKRMLQKKYIHFFMYNEDTIELFSKMKGSFKGSSAKIRDINQYARDQKELDQKISKQVTPGTGGVTAGPTSVVSDVPELIATGDEELMGKILEGEFGTENEQTLPAGFKQFPFFYLSSLLDVVMERLYNQPGSDPNFLSKNTRMLLCPITITDWGSLHDTGQIRVDPSFQGVESQAGAEGEKKFVKIYSGKKNIINLGDIPISLKDFTVWFNKNIMERNLEEMSLNDFISSLIQELVVTSLNNDVYSYAPAQKINIAFDAFTVDAGEKNERLFFNNMLNYKWSNIPKVKPRAGGFRMYADLIEGLRTTFSDSSKDEKEKDQVSTYKKNYIVLFNSLETPDVVTDSSEGRYLDTTRDKKSGIYHFFYGDSKSTIKNMKFSRIDNPHARADSVLSQNSSTKGTTRIVRESYNINLELFGNTDIQAGTYIYVSPTYPGAASVENASKILRDIGLGGYYFVTDVENTISLGNFTTSLKGIWQSSGAGNNSQNVIEQKSLRTIVDAYLEDIE